MSQRQVNAVRSSLILSVLLSVGFGVSAQSQAPQPATSPANAPVGAASQAPGAQRLDGQGATRLVVGPVAVIAESGLVLQPTEGLPNSVVADSNSQSEAAALWRIISARPDDLLSDIRQVQRLEAEVAQLRNERDTQKKLVSSLKVQLERANSGRDVLMGSALLLALIGAVAYFWPRTLRSGYRRPQNASKPHRNRRPVSFTPGKAGVTLISSDAVKVSRSLDIDFDSFGLASPSVTEPDSQKLESTVMPAGRH